MPDLSSYSKLV